jgi:hypothetical protein
MILSKLKLFSRDYRFQTLRPKTYEDPEIETEELLTDGNYARRSASSNAWIYLTIANLANLGITIALIFSSQHRPLLEINAGLRPVSWWCKYNSLIHCRQARD